MPRMVVAPAQRLFHLLRKAQASGRDASGPCVRLAAEIMVLAELVVWATPYRDGLQSATCVFVSNNHLAN